MPLPRKRQDEPDDRELLELLRARLDRAVGDVAGNIDRDRYLDRLLVNIAAIKGLTVPPETVELEETW